MLSKNLYSISKL